VSTAVASILADYLEGEPVETAATMDGTIVELLDGRFPALRRDCVVGPEEVIRQGAREYLQQQATGAEASS
jgi:cysteine desulfurase/selenocysteine lyase